jgi:hypothetical protein
MVLGASVREFFASTGTFVFGVIPASLLAVLAIMFGASPIYGFFEPAIGVWRSLVILLFTVPLSAMAILGCMGLFEVVGGTLTPRVARWLLAGVVANLVGILIVARLWSALAISCLFVPPLVVGCAHLARFLRHRAAAELRR